MSEKKIKQFPFVHKFFEYDPVTSAHILETMDEEDAILILKTLPPSLTADVCKHLNVDLAANLLSEVPPETFKEIISMLDYEEVASFFQHIPDTLRKEFLEYLPESSKRRIQELITYPEDCAARMMSTDFVYFHSDIKVADAIEKLRWIAHIKHPSSYVYVVDSENRLAGVLNMRELIIADPDTTLDKVMLENVFSINAYAEQNDVVNELSKRGYFAAPVVDNQNHLIGIVKTSELMTQGRDSASEDIQKMFGAGGNERVFSSVRFSLFKRLPWLHINLVTAFLAGIVVSMFESTIAQIAVLAVFIPIITDQAANAGSQSLAVVMRGLVMHEVSRKNVYRLISKEVQLALMTGLIIAIVTGVVSWLWQGNPYLGVVIGISMIITLIVAGFTGALVPIIMRHYGLDPAQSSAIIVTTITDVVGIFVFLGLAVLFKNLLISG